MKKMKLRELKAHGVLQFIPVTFNLSEAEILPKRNNSTPQQAIHPKANSPRFSRRRIKKLSLVFLVLTILQLIKAQLVYSVNIRTDYPLAGHNLAYYLGPILKASLLLAGVITFVLIVLGGFGMIASAGNTQQQEKGRNSVTAGIMGLTLVIAAYWIIQILELFFHVNILNPPI